MFTVRPLFNSIVIRLMLLILSVQCLLGATYYVDPETGDNTANGTSTATTWEHVPGTVGETGSGWVQLVHGDTLVVKGGTTNHCQINIGTTYFSGAASLDSILVISGHLFEPQWGTSRAIIDGEEARTCGIWIGANSAVRGVTVDGFEARNIAAGGIAGFGGTGSCCFLIGDDPGVNYITLRRCYGHDALRTTDDTGHGVETKNMTNSIIEMNTIGPNIGTKGIEVFGMLNRIRNNYVTDVGDHGIVLSGGRSDVYNNTIKMIGPWVHDPVFAMKIDTSVGATWMSTNDVWNNILFLGAEGTTTVNGFGLLDQTYANRIIHNTIHGFHSPNNFQRHGTGLTIDGNAVGVTNHFFANNIVSGCRNQQGYRQVYLDEDSATNTFSYNNFWGTNSSQKVFLYGNVSTNTVDEVQSQPLLRGNVATGNVQLNPGYLSGTAISGIDDLGLPNTMYFSLSRTAGSPLVYSTANRISGTAVNGFSSAADKFSLDILGTPRIRWSMGAYELPYTSLSGVSISGGVSID